MFRDEEKKLVAQEFYREAISLMNDNGFDYLVGGGFALKEHTGIIRDTKDLDLFCRAGDVVKILKAFNEKGYKTEYTDARWLAKAFKGNHFVDLIFNSVNNLFPVDDTLFDHAKTTELYGLPVKYLSAEDLLWCKVYIQSRDHYDGADVNHIILRVGRDLDWKRIFKKLDQHWHLLLAQFLNFQFIYPSERDIIPKWLFDELLERAKEQFDVPAPVDKVCRGPIVDPIHYNIDVLDWGFKVITMKRL